MNRTKHIPMLPHSQEKEYFYEIKHSDLYRCLKEGVITALKKLQEELPEDGSFSIPSSVEEFSIRDIHSLEAINIFNRISSCFTDIIGIPKVNEAIRCLAGNEIFAKAMFKNRDPSAEEKSVKAEYLFWSFLENYGRFQVFPKFSGKHFREIYLLMEYYLYYNFNSTNFLFAPLYAFEMEGAILKLPKGFILRRIKPYERIATANYSPNNDIQGVKYVIEFQSRETVHADEEMERFMMFIATLRLFKGGLIDYGSLLGGMTEDNWIKRFDQGLGFNKSKPPLYADGPYHLSKREMNEYRQFFSEYVKTYYNVKENPALNNAIRRFSTSIGEVYPEDKVIDLMIALESLFGTDMVELSYKLGVRSSILLGRNSHEAKYIYQFVKAAYNVRSRIVHGDKIEPIKISGKSLELEEAAVKLEGITRLCIQKFLNMNRRGDIKSKENMINLIDLCIINGSKKRLEIQSNGPFSMEAKGENILKRLTSETLTSAEHQAKGI